MNNTTVYVGMDVHKESFTLCAYTLEKEKGSYSRRTPADYKEVLKYLEFLRTVYGNDTIFVCGYEAGCLGYTLYHQLTDHHVDCVILAPTTMLEQRGKKRIKTDKRDAEIIGKCLAQHNYSPVHVPTASDEEVKCELPEILQLKPQITSFFAVSGSFFCFSLPLLASCP